MVAVYAEDQTESINTIYSVIDFLKRLVNIFTIRLTRLMNDVDVLDFGAV
jgi:hypothetical protein